MNFKKSNIVQITDEKHESFSVLLTVLEVDEQGIFGYVVSPPRRGNTNRTTKVDRLYVKNEQIEVVGDSIIVLKDSEDETEVTDDVRKGTEE